MPGGAERNMIVLSVSDVSLSFGTTQVLDRIRFAVNEGDRLGIIGVNGAGKTSLFRIITGEYTPDSGEVYLARGRSVGLLRQDEAVSAATPEQTVLEYMIAGFPSLLGQEAEIARLEETLTHASAAEAGALSARLDAAHDRFRKEGGLEFRARCRGMCLRLGFTEADLARRVLSLSGGEHTRLALSRLLSRNVDILMLDEPTNHLDVDALGWLEDFLAGYGKTVLVISHDRYFLDRVTDKTLQIERHCARLYNGNYSQAKLQMAQEAAAQDKAYREQQKQIAKIQANIEFQRRCGQEHNFVTIRSKEKQLEHMEKVEKTAPPPKDIRFAFRSEQSVAQEVVKVTDLTFSYGTEKPLLRQFSCLVRKDERVLFMGPNGCGKSTLMKLLVGKLSPTSGRVELGYGIRAGYYDQATASFDPEKTVLAELWDTYPQKPVGEIRSALAVFGFGAAEVEKQIASLSGGEKARLTLCKLMLNKINLLVLDEPTNHLDIGSREALENALDAFDGTVVAVSHDRYFVDRVATRIVEITPEAEGGAVTYSPLEGEGAYTAYVRRHALQNAQKREEKASAAPSDGRAEYEEKKRKNAEERAKARALEKARARAAALEEETAALKAELDGEAAAEYPRAAALQEQLDKAEEELLGLYEILL